MGSNSRTSRSLLPSDAREDGMPNVLRCPVGSALPGKELCTFQDKEELVEVTSQHVSRPYSNALAKLTMWMRPAASGNEWQKDRQFHALNAEAGLVEVKAVRGGRECLVTNTGVVVGDVLLLDTGDRVVADGIAVEAHGLTIDEARALALVGAPVLAHTLGFWLQTAFRAGLFGRRLCY